MNKVKIYGVENYIPKPVVTRSLITAIKKSFYKNKVKKLTFSEPKKVQLSFDAEVKKISEVSLLCHMPAKLSNDKQYRLKSDYLTEIGI